MEVIVLGAGGHSKVAIETASKCGYIVTAVFDDDETIIGSKCLGVPIIGRIADLDSALEGLAFVAIGNNRIRKKIAQRFTKITWTSFIHPVSYVSEHAQIGRGTLIGAGVVIQPDTKIGAHSIINTGSTVDHDCMIGDFSHICPGAHLAGGVVIGEGTMIGIGASIIPLKKVGSWSTVGAGAVVVKDVPDNITAIGVPARIIRESRIRTAKRPRKA